MKKIYITRHIPGPCLTMLTERGFYFKINQKSRPLTKKELKKELKKDQYDILLSLLTDTVDAEVLDAAPSLRLVANFAVGFNNIDVAECFKRGVIVTNTPGKPQTTSETVAEHTFALIFALAERIVEADTFVRKGKFKGWDPELFIGFQLTRKTIGIIGGGGIGERVAYHARNGFDMNVIYYDVKPNEAIETKSQGKRMETIEALLSQADIVSLHVPLLDSTKHLINEERLKLMKPTAFLINTARGPVVDEGALVSALKNGTIAGAGLDVFEFEPRLADGLTKLSNVVLTPHIASATTEARNEMSQTVAQNIIDFSLGKIPPNEVKAS